MERPSDNIVINSGHAHDQTHLSSASLEGTQDYEIEELSQPNISGLGARVEALVQSTDGDVEAKGTTASKATNEVDSSLTKPVIAKASEDAEVLPRRPYSFFHLFSLRDINSCILISENKRVICSVMISVLVVLSYAHLPHSIARSNSVIASRPLYILLLTDLTIVIARIIRKEAVPDEERADNRQGLQDLGHNWDGALRILEYGLVLYQTIRAIFIDCSFYLVIVICGLSLL